LEQWDLLHHRNPVINGVYKTFDPPKELLYQALLPSIGTYGVFYHDDNQWNMAYFVANCLSPLKDNATCAGTLTFNSDIFCKTREIDGYTEALAAPGLAEFGSLLDCNRVGSPIFTKSGICNSTVEWLGGVIRFLRDELGDDRRAVDGLIDLFHRNSNIPDKPIAPGAKAVLVVEACDLARDTD
jgi:hypothetical protein